MSRDPPRTSRSAVSAPRETCIHAADAGALSPYSISLFGPASRLPVESCQEGNRRSPGRPQLARRPTTRAPPCPPAGGRAEFHVLATRRVARSRARAALEHRTAQRGIDRPPRRRLASPQDRVADRGPGVRGSDACGRFCGRALDQGSRRGPSRSAHAILRHRPSRRPAERTETRRRSRVSCPSPWSISPPRRDPRPPPRGQVTRGARSGARNWRERWAMRPRRSSRSRGRRSCPLSRRCTSPGRGAAARLRGRPWCIKPLSKVPVQWPGPGCINETRGLVDHQELPVLVQDTQRERLGLDRPRLAHRDVTGDPRRPGGISRAGLGLPGR